MHEIYAKFNLVLYYMNHRTHYDVYFNLGFNSRFIPKCLSIFSNDQKVLFLMVNLPSNARKEIDQWVRCGQGIKRLRN